MNSSSILLYLQETSNPLLPLLTTMTLTPTWNYLQLSKWTLSKLVEAAHVADCSKMLFSNNQKKYKVAEVIRKYQSLKKPKVNKQYPAVSQL